MMISSLITFLTVGIASVQCAIAQDTSPTGPTHPNISKNCNAWYKVQSGDSCYTVETKYKISHSDFIKWNPDVSNDCLSNFWAGYSYCVGVNAQVTASSTQKPGSSSSSSSLSTPTKSSASTSTILASSSQNTTYSIREPITSWNITTPTTESAFPPKRTQPGQPSNCRDWQYVGPGDTCDTIVGSSSWVSMKEFLEWNPTIKEDCSGLFVGWWVCIGVQPQNMTGKFEYTITPPTLSVPPSPTKYTPPTYPSDIPRFTATPTQAGLAKECKGFHLAESGETCRQILNRYWYITEQQFFNWNPALKGNCEGLWAGYYYCIGVPGFTPVVPKVTTRPSSVPAGQPSNCNAWFQAEMSDTCDDIVGIFGAFSKAGFIAWNPSVGTDCKGIIDGIYYCVGIPGTPTTRTAPLTTSTFPTGTPVQSGIASDCNKLWFVSRSETCDSIAKFNSITVEQFLTWNPAVGAKSCDNLVPDVYVCVSVGKPSITGSESVPSSSPASTTGGSSATQKPSTTSSEGNLSTPTPVQAGMVSGCRRFYLAQSGDYCYAISVAARIDLSDFIKWNPAVKSDCGALLLGYWYCIGISGAVTTISAGPPVPT